MQQLYQMELEQRELAMEPELDDVIYDFYTEAEVACIVIAYTYHESRKVSSMHARRMGMKDSMEGNGNKQTHHEVVWFESKGQSVTCQGHVRLPEQILLVAKISKG